jgi:plasmid stabilization system protein ParE
MAGKYKISKRFKVKVTKTYEYLLNEWGLSVADAFFDRLVDKISTLQKYPFICKVTNKRFKIRRILLEKHNIIYYRIDGDTIVLVDLLNSKQNPKRNPYD